MRTIKYLLMGMVCLFMTNVINAQRPSLEVVKYVQAEYFSQLEPLTYVVTPTIDNPSEETKDNFDDYFRATYNHGFSMWRFFNSNAYAGIDKIQNNFYPLVGAEIGIDIVHLLSKKDLPIQFNLMTGAQLRFGKWNYEELKGHGYHKAKFTGLISIKKTVLALSAGMMYDSWAGKEPAASSSNYFFSAGFRF